jgi:hypothetical protein
MLFEVREAFDPVMTRCGAALLDDIKSYTMLNRYYKSVSRQKIETMAKEKHDG